MIGTFFKLIGKALRYSVSRPLQRFNINNRAKKHLGEDSKYFMPAPRAIGSLTLEKPKQYPHLEGQSSFKSIKQKRLEAIAKRNQRLLEASSTSPDDNARSSPSVLPSLGTSKSFSETIDDDNLVINASNNLSIIKTVTRIPAPTNVQTKQLPTAPTDLVKQDKPQRPLPTSTNLQLSDPAVIWQVDRVPPGRLDLSKLQELMINKLADDKYWTPKQISETYNIKEEYAENIITHLKQIRIVISPRVATHLEYVARNDPIYQATKHIIYHVDKSLRTEFDKQFDATFLPTDQLDPKIRELLDASAIEKLPGADAKSARQLMRRPQPLQLSAINRPPALAPTNQGKDGTKTLLSDGKASGQSE